MSEPGPDRLDPDVLHPELLDVVRSSFAIDVAAARPLLGLGDECLLWHVTAPRPLVVRIAPRWRSVAELQWAYGIAAALQRDVPEVVVPASKVVARWRGHPVTIWPYVPGRQLDRGSASDRAAAAELLARLHRAALAAPDPGPRPPSEHSPTACVVDLRDVTDRGLDETLASWRIRSGVWAPRGAVHGDFYRRNILVNTGSDGASGGDRRLGLLDWDEACVDVIGAELAWAIWEFCHVDERLDASRAIEFVAAYNGAAGPPYDASMIVPWIRDRLRLEVARNRAAAATGGYHDADYEAMEVRAFAALREVKLHDDLPDA